MSVGVTVVWVVAIAAAVGEAQRVAAWPSAAMGVGVTVVWAVAIAVAVGEVQRVST